MYETLMRKGYRGVESSWILETNDAMNRIVESGGAKIYRKYRMYDLPLAA